MLYLAYILGVISLATSYRTNHLFSYGGWVLVQMVALSTVVLGVKLTQRAWLIRGHVRHGREEGGRWRPRLRPERHGGSSGGPGVLGALPDPVLIKTDKD